MAASGSVSHALRPYFDEMFLGRADVATTLRDAQAAANAAAQR
jgi:multiple sugar transport system substrate-binding protein